MAYTIRTINYTGVKGTALVQTVYESDVMTKGRATFRRWRTCPICAFDFPEDQMTRQGGKWYCIPNGCYRDTDTRWA